MLSGVMRGEFSVAAAARVWRRGLICSKALILACFPCHSQLKNRQPVRLVMSGDTLATKGCSWRMIL